MRVPRGAAKSPFGLFVCLCLLAQAPARNSDGNPDRSRDLNAVKAEAQRHPRSFTFLQDLTDRIGPRLTGSSQEAKAGEWALQTMRAIGLQNVHGEPWQLERGWRRGYARCELLAPFPLELRVVSYGWTGSTAKRGITAEIVRLDSDALDQEVRKNSGAWAGKVLFLTPKDPAHSDAFQALSRLPGFLQAAVRARAAAVILHDRRPGALLPHTGPLGFPGRSSTLAVLDIAREHETMLARLLDSGTTVRVRIDVRNEFTAGAVSSSNIVGEIPGTRHPEEVVLLGAHLDSWDLGSGAIDDGFGVAAVLGAAQSIVAAGVKPDRTLRFVLFTGEEQGLLGSRAYTRAHQRELANFVCALILDWGQGRITKLPLAGHSELAATFEELFRAISGVAPVQVAAGYLTFTDAFAFTLAGVPGIAPLQDSQDYAMWAHSAADTLDKVSPEVLALDSTLLALTALWTADYPTRPGSVWSPERTARELRQQQSSLELLGLWPFQG